MPNFKKRRERLVTALDSNQALDKDYTWAFESLDNPKRYLLHYWDSVSENDDENNQTFLQFTMLDEATQDIRERYEKQSGMVFDYLYDLDRDTLVKVQIELQATVTLRSAS